MKRQLRRNVFETNSSSMHSLVLMKDGGYYTPEEISNSVYISQEGKWRLYEHELYFGRSPFKVLTTFAEKWKYALATLVYEDDSEYLTELERIAYAYIPGFREICYPTKNSCKERKTENSEGLTENEMFEFLGHDDFWIYKDDDIYWRYKSTYYGGTDEDFLSGFMKKENVSLEEFITNKKYVVIVDGDEYCIWEGLIDSGLINTDKIEKEY